ncbi:SRPBCC family protein [Streptomyces sp. NPDC047000]|uniref:SRPBCC family protein n=1 Tax=Streptomyces sp. NPDC047000 TaxID=3155474 RepID=UPI0033CFEA90
MTGESGAGHRLAGTLHVALPPDQAFRLFTPRGEEDWAPGWAPRFPAAAAIDQIDDTAPGTVFETHAEGCTTTWMVVDRVPGRSIRYARVVPHRNAGTVTVALDSAENPSPGSRVTVTYELTALTDAGRRHLEEFASGYAAYLRSWQDAIGASLDPRASTDRSPGARP